jgi:uncharacterized protein YcbK (DUF882 family)
MNQENQSQKKKLRLFCPADKIDWSCNLETDREVQLCRDIASRLGLAIKVDEEIGKLFLGRSSDSSDKKSHQNNGKKDPSGVVNFPGGSVKMALISETEANKYGVTNAYDAARLLDVEPDFKLSNNFSASEFFCHDTETYKYVRVSPKLIQMLEKIREKVGPLRILSAYRPPAYNRSVGGASNSCHIDGLAADICGNVSTEKLLEVAESVIGDDGGVGYYPGSGFVHIDVRGYGARWQG